MGDTAQASTQIPTISPITKGMLKRVIPMALAPPTTLLARADFHALTTACKSAATPTLQPLSQTVIKMATASCPLGDGPPLEKMTASAAAIVNAMPGHT